MKTRIFVAMATLTGILYSTSQLSADVLYMNDGQKQVGVIIKQKTNASSVTIRTTGGDITLPRTRISRIESQAADVSYGLLGDAYLATGDFDKAVESYETGLKFNSGNLDLKQKIQQAHGGVATQNAQTQVAMDDQARRVVEQAMKLAAGENFEAAVNTLRSIEPSDTSPMITAYNKAVANIDMLWGQYMLDRQNTGGAAQKFTEVLNLDPDNTRAKELLVKTFAGDPTKLKESAEFYIKSDAPEDQLKGADALYKLQQYEQALPIYMKYMDDSDLNTRYNITQRLTFLLDTLHQQYAARGDYQKALAYFTAYLQVNPDPDADPLPYSKYTYMIKRSQTDMNDPNSRLQLALLGEQLGLIDTAKEEYRNILSLDPKSSGALTALRRFAESDLADAKDFMSQQQYTLADQMAEDLVAQYTMYPDIVAAANQIQATARVEAQKAAQNTKREAQALAERGDNYYERAMQYVGAYVSTDTDNRKRLFSPRNEAAKYLGQAIFAWKTAVQMDPALGDPTTYNLYYKIQDASAKYSTFANRRPPALPPRQNISIR